ncbi:MAG: aspartate-semialdehyde dehydrogenase [Elusimicrobiales bacterium]|nr:aspartate-semialdehyde dehydrogenase [Elusimicrobiales bacterium]
MMKKLKAGILGATGTVGQKFVTLLREHPWFEVSALGASEISAGQTYGQSVASKWKQSAPVPPKIAAMRVRECRPEIMDCDFVFSGLDAAVAGDIEKNFAAAGMPVISNTKNYRMEPDIPLLVPEVNPGHAALIPLQKKRGWKGFIATNPNCVAVPLVMALKPVLDEFGLSKVMVFSMQAISGAGYPGVPSLDILDNIIPHIGGEEPKVETEPLKILGSLERGKVRCADFAISAQCNRVAVSDGHSLNVSFSTRKKTSVAKIRKALENFTALPQKLHLPSAPQRPLVYLDGDFRPQPRLDRGAGGGMTVSAGRLRECPVLGFKMALLGHNTIRGAAGAAILNAELLFKLGYIKQR